MNFRPRDLPTSLVRPRVTPDPQQAANVERRMSELVYYPENGFHRDRRQQRRTDRGWRLGKRWTDYFPDVDRFAAD